MLLDLFTLKEKYEMNIKGIAHIGAHFGQENVIYDRLGIKNRIFFEPISSNFDTLRKNLGETYQLFKVALGNENKKIMMNVETANSGQSSSILKPKVHLTQYPHILFESTEEVDMRRLDDMDINFDDINFITIDVQGYELEVFKGAKKTLDKIDYIVSEINRDEVYENCAKIGQLEEFLSPYGFKLVERNWVGGTWGDGLFVKQKQF
jgi:FkbM family methyltransferase